MLFTSPSIPPDEICEGEGLGKFPETVTTFVEGEMPTTSKKDAERPFPVTVGGSVASNAPIEISFGSYAAPADRNIWAIFDDNDESLNFSGLSFNFVQSGFQAV